MEFKTIKVVFWSDKHCGFIMDKDGKPCPGGVRDQSRGDNSREN
jgi:hypothetical protein